MDCENIAALVVVIAMTVASFNLAAGCSDGESIPPIQEGIDVLENGTSIFSFIYVEDPPEGDLFYTVINEPRIAAPCDLYRIDADIGNELPFWTFSVTTGNTAPGTYPIIPFYSESKNRDSAGAALRYVKNDSTSNRYSAVGGEVIIEQAPQDSNEWHGGVLLQMHVRAEFPKVSLSTKECNVDCTDDGCTGTCSCENPEGKESTCDLNFNDDIEEETCCIDINGPNIVFESEVVAEPCSELCSWISDYPHLGQYCQALL